MFHNCLFFSKYWVPTSQKFQILSTQITFQVLKFQINILQLSNTWVLTCFTIASFFSKYWVPTSQKLQILSTQITFQALKFQINILQLLCIQVLTLLKVIDQKSYNLNQDRFWKCLKILIQILSTQTKFWEIECRIKHLLYLSTNEKTNQFCNWSFLWIYMIKFLILSTHTRLVLQNGYFTLVTYASTSAGFQLLNFTDSMWMEAF